MLGMPLNDFLFPAGLNFICSIHIKVNDMSKKNHAKGEWFIDKDFNICVLFHVKKCFWGCSLFSCCY